MSDKMRGNNHDNLKRFEITTRFDSGLLCEIGRRWRCRMGEECFPSRVLRDRPNVRLDRALLETVREEVKREPDLNLQDAFEEALALWLVTRKHHSAGISLLQNAMQPGENLAI